MQFSMSQWLVLTVRKVADSFTGELELLKSFYSTFGATRSVRDSIRVDKRYHQTYSHLKSHTQKNLRKY